MKIRFRLSTRATRFGYGLVCIIIATPGVDYAQEFTAAQSQFQVATLLADGRKPTEAFYAFEKAMRISRKLGQHEVYIRSVNKLASLADSQAQQDSALSWIQTAVPLFDKLGWQNLDVADLNYYAGFYYFWNLPSEMDRPIVCYEKARNIRVKLLGETSEGVANCYSGLGDVYRYHKFDYLEAEKSYERALEIMERLGSTDQMRLASCYYSLANTNREQKDYEKAIGYGLKTIELVKKTGNLGFLDRTYSMIANIYRDMGLTGEAMNYYSKAIELHPSTHDRPGLLASYYAGLGQAFLDEKNFPKALLSLKKAQVLFGHRVVEDQMPYAQVLQLLGMVYLSTNEYDKFVENDRLLMGVLKDMKLERSRKMSETLYAKAIYFHKRRQVDSALYYCQKSMAAAIRSFDSKTPEDNPTQQLIGTDFYIYEVLNLKAQLFEELYRSKGKANDLRQAIACLLLSERLLSIGRNTIDVEVSRWNFSASNFDIYEKAISLLYEMADKHLDLISNEAFYFFERSKAQSLTRALTDAGQAKKLGISDSLLSILENYKKTQFGLQAALEKELDSKNLTNPKKVETLRQAIVVVDRKMQESRNIVELKYPGYFRVQFQDSVPRVEKIQEMASLEKCYFLEFFWGKQDVYALGIGGDKIKFCKVGSTETMRSMTSSIIAHLTGDMSLSDRKAFFSFQENAFELYKMCIQPVENQMGGSRRIRLIPDGQLSQIPFEVLITNKNTSNEIRYDRLDYLLKQYEISYLYTLSLLLNGPRDKPAASRLLGMGFTNRYQASSRNLGLASISGSGKELDMLDKRFGGGKFLVGENSTEGNFKSFAPSFDIIHLAVHGRGDTEKNYTASLFFQAQNDSAEDGELHAYELYGMKLHAQLAVLTACESGLGKNYLGEGMVSMASAFTYSGCRNILMGMWKVPDQVDVLLMDDFYKELLEGRSIDLALADAKRNYLSRADELTADPRIWAPLVVYGDQYPVQEKSQTHYYVAGGLLFLLIGFLSRKFWFRRRNVSVGHRL